MLLLRCPACRRARASYPFPYVLMYEKEDEGEWCGVGVGVRVLCVWVECACFLVSYTWILFHELRRSTERPFVHFWAGEGEDLPVCGGGTSSMPVCLKA
jgi:hypothetical protein